MLKNSYPLALWVGVEASLVEGTDGRLQVPWKYTQHVEYMLRLHSEMGCSNLLWVDLFGGRCNAPRSTWGDSTLIQSQLRLRTPAQVCLPTCPFLIRPPGVNRRVPIHLPCTSEAITTEKTDPSSGLQYHMWTMGDVPCLHANCQMVPRLKIWRGKALSERRCEIPFWPSNRWKSKIWTTSC